MPSTNLSIIHILLYNLCNHLTSYRIVSLFSDERGETRRGLSNFHRVTQPINGTPNIQTWAVSPEPMHFLMLYLHIIWKNRQFFLAPKTVSLTSSSQV